MLGVQGVDAQSQYNLGHLLLSFLDFFGNRLDYSSKAVSVRAVSIKLSHTSPAASSARLLKDETLSSGVRLHLLVPQLSLHLDVVMCYFGQLSKVLSSDKSAGRHCEEGEALQAEGQAPATHQ